MYLIYLHHTSMATYYLPCSHIIRVFPINITMQTVNALRLKYIKVCMVFLREMKSKTHLSLHQRCCVMDGIGGVVRSLLCVLLVATL